MTARPHTYIVTLHIRSGAPIAILRDISSYRLYVSAAPLVVSAPEAFAIAGVLSVEAEELEWIEPELRQ